MKSLRRMLADLRERNGVLTTSTGAWPSASLAFGGAVGNNPSPDETTIRTQLARRGYKLMRRRPPGNADTRFWLMFAEPQTLEQLNAFINRLDGVKP